ncbi:MAG: hypothetical protein RRB13_14880 [bacterium]|nr:hypothetical protein [bacterium]
MADTFLDDSFQIVVHHAHGQVTRTEVHSRRALETHQLLIGRGPEEVVRMLPRLYPLGAKGHQTAALWALEEAYGLGVKAYHHRARALLVHLEIMTQTLTRLLADWPALLGKAPINAPLAAIETKLTQALYGDKEPFFFGERSAQADLEMISQVAAEMAQLLETHLLGYPPKIWASLTVEHLMAWVDDHPALGAEVIRYYGQLPALKNPEIAPLGWPSHQDWNQALTSPYAVEMIYLPELNGQKMETGAFARQARNLQLKDYAARRANPLVLRLLGRLVDLCWQQSRLELGMELPAQGPGVQKKMGIGLAQIESTRGRVVHRIEMAADKTRRYQLLSAAEWNFHPKGMVPLALAGLVAKADQISAAAAAWTRALDPFVRAPIKLVRDA